MKAKLNDFTRLEDSCFSFLVPGKWFTEKLMRKQFKKKDFFKYLI